MVRPSDHMGEQLSELGIKENVNRSKPKILPSVKAIHEINKEDFSMKVMDHNYYVQENWENYKYMDETFMQMVYRKISNILH